MKKKKTLYRSLYVSVTLGQAEILLGKEQYRIHSHNRTVTFMENLTRPHLLKNLKKKKKLQHVLED